MQTQIQEPPPYYFFGIPLHNKRVAQQFCFVFLLVFIVPLSVFFGLRESMGDVVAGISAVVSVQFIFAIYIMMIVKDPENFPNAEKARKMQEEKKISQLNKTQKIEQSDSKKDALKKKKNQ